MAVDVQRHASLRGFQLLFAQLSASRNETAFAVVAHPTRRVVVVAVRGTNDLSDAMIDARALGQRLSLKRMGGAGVVDGWAHCGMLTAARLLFDELFEPLTLLHEAGHQLLLTGHSLGAGVAVLLAALLREKMGDVQCVGYATPPVASGEGLLEELSSFCTSLLRQPSGPAPYAPLSLGGGGEGLSALFAAFGGGIRVVVSAVGARAVLRLQVVDGGGREGGGKERGERGGGQLVQASVSARPAEAVLRLGVGWGGGGESLREVSSVPGASRQASLGVGEENALILAEDERMSECYSVQTTTAKGEVEEEVRCTGLVLSEEGGWAVQASAFSEEGERGGEESAFSEEARRVKEARALSEEVRRVAEAEVVDAMVIAAAKLESGALPFEYDPKVRPPPMAPSSPCLANRPTS
ncbi:MAG: hypothetical protein SGPRY_010526 [Prymnesium sp.]